MDPTAPLLKVKFPICVRNSPAFQSLYERSRSTSPVITIGAIIVGGIFWAIGRADRLQSMVIDEKMIAKARKKGFEITRLSRFQYRTRHFSDSGIIGSKEFVSANYQRIKHLFQSKHEKKPKPVKGLSGIYSLKRLSEVI